MSGQATGSESRICLTLEKSKAVAHSTRLM